MTDPSPVVQALIRALDARGQGDTVALAFADDGVVFRQGWGLRFGQVDERFDGHDEIALWMQRSPEGTRFFTASNAEKNEAGWSVRYRVTLETFENHGTWSFTLHGARLRALWHQPDNLPGLPETQPAPHDHDHKHG